MYFNVGDAMDFVSHGWLIHNHGRWKGMIGWDISGKGNEGLRLGSRRDFRVDKGIEKLGDKERF